MDLFDLIHSKVGCLMLSDIKFEPYRSCACEKLKTINLADYPLSQLQDLAQYLFDEKVIFSDYSEVNEYFSKKIKQKMIYKSLCDYSQGLFLMHMNYLSFKMKTSSCPNSNKQRARDIK